MKENTTYIRVVGDVNDGDYIEEWTDLDVYDKEDREELLEELSKFEGKENIDIESEDIPDIIREILPYFDNQELHTIVSLQMIRLENVVDIV